MTQSRGTPDEREQLVRLPLGFAVRRQFTRKATRGLPNHTPAAITMAITVDVDGRPYVHGVLLSAEGMEPFGDTELAELGASLIEARDELLRIEAQEMTPDRGYAREDAFVTLPEDLDSTLARDADAALQSVRIARRRRQVTPALLAKVLDLYEQGGIQRVRTETNYSESYCFKLLRKAREEASST